MSLSGNIPERGSRWMYDGKEIEIGLTYTRWWYVNGVNPVAHDASTRLFDQGQPHPSFTPVPKEVKPGETYVSHQYEFYVYEVLTKGGKAWAFGRESSIDGYTNGVWYPESYLVEDLLNESEWEPKEL